MEWNTDALYIEEHSALVSGTLASCSTGSFYGSLGTIDGELAAASVAGDGKGVAD